MEDEARAWTRLIAQLALMPDVVAKIRAEHTSDGNGRCMACTTPGRGTPHVRWPCVLAAMAASAHRVREATVAQLTALTMDVSR